MRQSSQKSTAEIVAREPTRKRGHEKVARLLAAAAAVFADAGYDKATMTDIAVQAGTSVGSLYQFFPTKDVLADALHARHLEAFEALLQRSLTGASGLAAGLERLFAALPDFLTEYPAFLALADRRALDRAAKASTRAHLRAVIAAYLQAAEPGLGAEVAFVQATVLLHLLKAAMQVTAEADLPQRDQVLDALRDRAIGPLT